MPNGTHGYWKRTEGTGHWKVSKEGTGNGNQNLPSGGTVPQPKILRQICYLFKYLYSTYERKLKNGRILLIVICSIFRVTPSWLTAPLPFCRFTISLPCTSFCFLVANGQVITLLFLSFVPPMHIATQCINTIQQVYCSSSGDNAIYHVKCNP